MDDLFQNNKKFQKLFECFLELAKTDTQKDAIEQIMKKGKYNGFILNSTLSNEKYNEKAEIKRRITFTEIVLHDQELFLYLVNNGLNVFHGTKIDALENILSKGLFSSYELSKKEIQLNTGEELTMNKVFGNNGEKRNFISLTDDFDTSALYAGFPYEEQSEYVKKYYGKDMKSDIEIPIIICFNGANIERKYSQSLVTIQSTCNEIGLNTHISPTDIKCIITSYDKIDYVKSIVSKYGINVLGYDHNDKFEKRLINDKEGKFYSSNMEIDEQQFKKIKEKKMNANNKNLNSEEKVNNQIDITQNSLINQTQNTERLSEDESMKVAANIKMDILFYLIEQYNKGIPVVPIISNTLITKYNLNENVAKNLELEINKLLENYVQEKKYQKGNYKPFILDEIEETESIGGKHY